MIERTRTHRAATVAVLSASAAALALFLAPSRAQQMMNRGRLSMSTSTTRPAARVRMGTRLEPTDPAMKTVLDALGSFNVPPIQFLTPFAARNAPDVADAVQAVLSARGRPVFEPVGDISHRVLRRPDGGQVLMRIYKPRGMAAQRGLPVSVYFHGGGFVIANLDTYDASCRAIANAARTIVVSVAYRQGPERRFPTAHEDSYAATQFVMRNAAVLGGDARRVAVVGESAGGNLATAVCLMARDRRGRMPIHQVLVYPIAQHGQTTASMRQHFNARPLNTPMLGWFERHYLRSAADRNSPYASPLRANLRGLPPATIVAAEIDPLRSEGALYARRLAAFGVPVRYRLFTDVTHEFFGAGAVVPKARQAVAFAAAGLRGAFAR